MFKGTATALITPFTENGVDFDSLEKLLDFQLNNRIDALVVLGTTGEPPTMTKEEKLAVMKFAIKKVDHKIPVILGTGSNCTKTAIANTIEAAELGADGALVVTPFYNKCTQEGLYLHYKAICEASPIPVIAYNVPARTGVNILPETLKKLTSLKQLQGIKDACGKSEQIEQMGKVCQGTHVNYYSGDDEMVIEAMQAGGSGLISVASNILPNETSSVVKACLEKDYAKAQAILNKYRAIDEALFYEVNPIPVKYAAYKMGLCQNILRLPLTPLSENNAQRLEAIMKDLQLI